MSAPQKFRSAFNGFNREDVAGYLEYLGSKHAAQVQQLNSEIHFLRTKLESAPSVCDQSETVLTLEQERDSLRSQLEELRERFVALEQELANVQAPAQPPEEELEIYRRAERTERMARERADMIFRQTNGILNEASVRVNDMADQVMPIADELLSQVNKLQQTVLSSKQSLQDAVVIINTLRPDHH